jgi:ribulose-5-phosphate 4-epimerase/fuculose-1-phosphate aldolase
VVVRPPRRALGSARPRDESESVKPNGGNVTSVLEETKQDLVSANRILGHENILDVFGHVSVRHPEDPTRFLLSRARSPEVVETADLLEFDLDGAPVVEGGPAPYLERFIHAAIYEANPEIQAVCHSHTPSILPFSISRAVRLQAVVHTGRFLGGDVPVWDIADEFGTETTMLVVNQAQGRSLNATMAGGPIVLMRGHGCAVAASDLIQLVGMCMGMDRNAQVQLAAHALGDYTPIHEGEYREVVQAATAARPVGASRGDNRGWEYYRNRAGVLELGESSPAS